MHQLYEELVNMPLWTMSAFGTLKVRDVNHSQFRLASYLVLQWMNKCPSLYYDRDTRHDWKVSTYFATIRQAVVAIRLKEISPKTKEEASRQLPADEQSAQ